MIHLLLVKILLELGTKAPIVNCSRSGAGCPTSVFDLQQHNGHVPMFDNEKNLLTYVDRIVKDVEKACSVIDWNLNMIKKEAIESLTFTLKNYIKDNNEQ